MNYKHWLYKLFCSSRNEFSFHKKVCGFLDSFLDEQNNLYSQSYIENMDLDNESQVLRILKSWMLTFDCKLYMYPYYYVFNYIIRLV